MLIRFLSFTASVIGTARYKTVLLACTAVVLGFTGITAAAIVRNNHLDNAASKVEQSASQKQKQDSPPQLGGISKQNPKADDQSSATQTPDTSEQTTNNDQSAPSTNTPVKPAATPDISLNKSDVTLKADGPSELVTGTINDTANVTWTITLESSNSDIHAEVDQSAGATFSFRVSADKNTTLDTYIVKITAKDASRNIVTTKLVSVTVIK